jgi:FkbM family methyltransferase
MGWGVFSSLLKMKRQEAPAAILPLMEQHVPRDGVIIDIGAGTGAFTNLFAKAAPEGHVYAFETGKAMRSVLSKVIAVRRLGNVSLFPVGLGGGETKSACPVMNASAGNTVHTTLDEFASRHALKKVDFIRAESGKAQLQVLHGAQETIDRHRPILLLATNDDGDAPEEVRSFLRGANYHIGSHGKDLLCIAEEKTEDVRWDGDTL